MNWLLTIGINEYARVAPLRGAVKDADAVERVLRERYGFSRVHSLRNGEATSRGVHEAFIRMIKEGGPEDSLVVFFAGHGKTVDYSNTGYLLPQDAGDDEVVKERWISNQEIRGYLSKMPHRHVLMISDACFSGDLLNRQRDIVESRRTPDFFEQCRRFVSREVLTSGASHPVSDSGLGGHSPFTFHLLDTLARNRERFIDPMDLHVHVRAGVKGQQPLYGCLEDHGHQQGGHLLLELEDPVLGTGGIVSTDWNSGGQDIQPSSAARKKELCPLCGMRNDPDDTFRCLVCGRDYLCKEHFVKTERCCEACAAERDQQRKAEAEKKRRAAEAERRRENPEELELDCGGGVVLKLRRIEAGSFMMGSENGYDDEKPVHKVTITQPFYMGIHPVTQAQWRQVMGSNPSFFKGDTLPVETVSWENAMAFCGKLSRKTGRTVGLPTEAQWEYACRAGTTGDYAGKLDTMAWYDKNSGSTTHPVGTKQPNAWGLYDMHGNVWEWCLDWYGAYPAGSVVDPQGPSSGSYRVFRGGCWCYFASSCRSAYRDYFSPGIASFDLGFRPLVLQR